jgi:hypothetical protein
MQQVLFLGGQKDKGRGPAEEATVFSVPLLPLNPVRLIQPHETAIYLSQEVVDVHVVRHLPEDVADSSGVRLCVHDDNGIRNLIAILLIPVANP